MKRLRHLGRRPTTIVWSDYRRALRALRTMYRESR